MIEQKNRLKERIKAIEKLEFIVANNDINKLGVWSPLTDKQKKFLKGVWSPLTDKQKKFLKLIKSGKTSIADLQKNMPCSRPMVYKYYEMFLNKQVFENRRGGYP
jgi:hypothetical protein